MVNEVPVFRAVIQKGEMGSVWLLGSALGHVCKGQVASLGWDRSSVGLCVFGCCKTRPLWSDIMIMESQSRHLAAIPVFWVSAFLCKPQTISSTSAGWFSSHSYRTWGLPQQKNYFLENSFNLKPLSLLHVECYVVSNWKSLGAKNLWEERSTGMFSVVSRTFLVQVFFHSPCSNFFLSFSS